MEADRGSHRTSDGSSTAVPLPVDRIDMPDCYTFVADMPGLRQRDIKIQVVQRRLVISGERRLPGDPGSAGNSSNQRQQHIERRFGQFSRAIPLPADADVRGINASVEFGVLTVTVHKQHIGEL
ncbi:hypothetical protein WJX72_010193 [[Myrmecia] bisecta]|uniref:SHSP domain-containing protein n=1 Tax=[Myrmecia] bisecta TaxID=41462 RepID=A0AAW1PR66_9CHLO